MDYKYWGMRAVTELLRKLGMALLAVVLLVLAFMAIKPILVSIVMGIAVVIIFGVLLKLLL